MNRFSRLQKIAVVGLVVALVASVVVVVVLSSGPAQKEATAYFDQSVNLYPGDEVRVLGVPVGAIDTVTAEPTQVRVTLHYSLEDPLPASTTAAIVSPTLVGVRYLQLGPPYAGGPQLPDGAVIPHERTAQPVEFDQIRNELAGLATALGPNTADAQGAAHRLLDATAANLNGNGQSIHDTITGLSQLLTTLSDNRGDLFSTIRNLDTFTQVLRDSDTQVDQFNNQLAQVSTVLAQNDNELGTALAKIRETLPIVQHFVRDNRGALISNIEALNRVAQNVADNRQGLADVLQRAPTALSNFNNIFDERTGAVTAALSATNLRDPATFICGIASGVPPGGDNNPDATNFCKAGLGGLLDTYRLDNAPVGLTPPPIETGSGNPGGNPADNSLTNLVAPGGHR